MGLQNERFQHLLRPNELPSTATPISTLEQFLNWKQSWSEKQVSLSPAISMSTNDSGQVSRHLPINISLKKSDSMDVCCLYPMPQVTAVLQKLGHLFIINGSIWNESLPFRL